jgi:hypothetical protein
MEKKFIPQGGGRCKSFVQGGSWVLWGAVIDFGFEAVALKPDILICTLGMGRVFAGVVTLDMALTCRFLRRVISLVCTSVFFIYFSFGALPLQFLAIFSWFSMHIAKKYGENPCI